MMLIRHADTFAASLGLRSSPHPPATDNGISKEHSGACAVTYNVKTAVLQTHV